MFEVEKRALLKDEEELKKLKSYLEEHGKFVEEKNLTTFMFRKPYYLRVRITEGKPNAVITHKIGTYDDLARKEIEFEVPVKQIGSFLELISELGFELCLYIKTKRLYYKLDGLSVEINIGVFDEVIAEVEALTEKEAELKNLNGKVSQMMKRLNLIEIDSHTYLGMVNKIYAKKSRTISEILKELHQ